MMINRNEWRVSGTNSARYVHKAGSQYSECQCSATETLISTTILVRLGSTYPSKLESMIAYEDVQMAPIERRTRNIHHDTGLQ